MLPVFLDFRSCLRLVFVILLVKPDKMQNTKWYDQTICPPENCNFNRLPKKPPPCPDNFTDATVDYSVCYVLTSKTSFPPKCPYVDLAPFQQYREIIKSLSSPVWMPARRPKNGTGFYQWLEASENYKTDVDFNYNYSSIDPIVGKDCLLYYNTSYIQAVSCDESYIGICAYRKLDGLHVNVCSSGNPNHECLPTDYAPNMKCYCKGSNTQLPTTLNGSNRAEFLKFYQVNVYNSLTTENCTIGLEKKGNDKYIWARSKTEIDYDYWAPDGKTFDGKYGVITPNGWVLANEENQPGCYLFEKMPEYKEPLLLLQYSDEEDLIVTAVNYKNLKRISSDELFLFCFTDASTLNLIYRYPVFSKGDIIDGNNKENISFKFQPIRTIGVPIYRTTPGNYWCESLKYPNLLPVVSNTIFLRNPQFIAYEHVVIMTVDLLDPADGMPQPIKRSIEFTLRLSVLLGSDVLSEYHLRIMKILHVDEESKRITLNIHLTYKGQKPVRSPKEEFCRIKTNLPEAFKEMAVIMNISIVDFLSADYCFENCSAETNLTWPDIKVDETKFPEELCFEHDSSRVSRTCGGNFIDGARWVEKESDDYECLNESEITKDLITILENNDLVALANLSCRYRELEPVDVYLVGNILRNFSHKPIALNNSLLLPKMIDNFLRIHREVLYESQLKTNATNIILDSLNIIFEKSFDFIEMKLDNFWISKKTSKTLEPTIVLFQNGSVKTTHENLNAVKDYEDLESALFIGPDLLKKIEAEDRNVTITIFFNDAFFNRKNNLLSSRRVFGTSGIFDKEVCSCNSDKKLFILQRNNIFERGKKCGVWEYSFPNETRKILGNWQSIEYCVIVPPFSQCNFFEGSHFTVLTSIGNNNITHKLEDILQTNKTVTEIMKTLRNISQRYDEITSYDVSLIAKVLAKISNEKNVDLKMFTEIMNNFLEINRDILATAQKEANSTDLILYHTDKIIKNQHCDLLTNLKGEKFASIIWTQEANITGVIILNNDGNLEQETLQGKVDIDKLLQKKNLKSAVFFTPQLMGQMTKHSKIVVTIYENDVMFNGKSALSKNISRIFGITLTEILGDYKSPVTIFHKTNNRTHRQKSCSFWNYDLHGSHWYRDNSGTGNTFIKCEYWHTTHFALLLSDKDLYDYDKDSLDWITAINCVLSAFGLACIILTAILFKTWRRNIGNQILVHFASAIAMQIATFYISTMVKETGRRYGICIIIGVALHYSVVSQFCWMFIIAILQFKRFVEVLGGPPKYVILKSCLCGWALPLLPVFCVLSLDYKNYAASKTGLCYPTGLSLYLGVWLPISIIVAVNLVIFIFIIFNVVHKKTECADSSNNDLLFQWRLAVLLFFMLGITWTFGFLSETEYGVIFVYLFSTTATLQGFVMFLFFIVFNTPTRRLYVQAIKKCCQKSYY